VLQYFIWVVTAFTHLWCLKKIKSLWLWNVAERLPWNWGSYGNRDASNLATEWPSLVLKLFRITSGRCDDALPWFYIKQKEIDIRNINECFHLVIWLHQLYSLSSRSIAHNYSQIWWQTNLCSKFKSNPVICLHLDLPHITQTTSRQTLGNTEACGDSFCTFLLEFCK
jgi:hypothetical protein